LTVSAQLSESPALRQALQEVLRAIKGGKSLSAALERYPRLFPNFYVSLIRAGEASGNLSRVFTQLADYQESVNELQSNLVSAMIYPALLFVVGGASVLFLLEFVVPKFAGVFEQSGAALPLPTQVLLYASGALQKTWWLGVIAVPVIILGVQRYLSAERGRQRFDRFILRVPRLGSVIERIQELGYTARRRRAFGPIP
jgi:general secretion pathway protein F